MRTTSTVVAFLLLTLGACAQKPASEADDKPGGAAAGSEAALFAEMSDALLDEGSARFEFTSVSTFAEYPAGSEPPKPVGSGVIDFKGKRGSMTFDLDGEGSKDFDFPRMEQIFTPDFFFIKIQPDARERLGGKEWIKAPRELVSGSPNPNGMNDVFLNIDAETVSEEGTEEVRGDKTTRYKFEIPIEAFLATVPEDMKEQARKEAESSAMEDIPGRVWIDEEGRPRRYQIEFGAEKFKTSVSYELFDFGTKVDIDPPADAICHVVNSREAYQKATSQMFTMHS